MLGVSEHLSGLVSMREQEHLRLAFDAADKVVAIHGGKWFVGRGRGRVLLVGLGLRSVCSTMDRKERHETVCFYRGDEE